MGLLSQIVLGGLGAAADTTSKIMVDNNRMAQESERDRANALREENLLKLRQTLSDQASDREFTRSQGAELAKEERAFNRGDSHQVNAEGVPLTRAEAAAIRKQEEAAQAEAMEQGPTQPRKSGLISAAKYSEETTISKDFTDPDGKLITVAEAKKRQQEGLPLKLREDLEHDRTRKEKDEDREKDLTDYEKKKKIDTKEAIKQEKAKSKEPKETDATRTGPTLRYVKAARVRKSDGTVGPGVLTFDMSDPTQRKWFSGWITKGQGVEVFAGEDKVEEDGVVTKTKKAPAGLAQAKPAASGTRFVIKSVK